MLESVKYPNAARIRYAYPGQTRSSYDSNVTLGTPSWIATVVEDDTGNPISQVTKNTFDTSGRLLTSTDPANRVTRYTYSAAGDLSKVELQTSAGVFSTLTNVLYNAQHLPTQVTDAAGQVTSASYNAIGQILTTTAPQSTGTGTDVTTFTYTGQRLTGVTMPVVPGDVAKSVSIAYDAVDRPMTVTGIDGTVTTTAYDNLDRPTKITYQDNSSVDVVWNKLDATQISDRTGRITRRAFTALGQLASVTDPAGRRTLFDWCKCGRLQTLTDASGNVTNWNYDQHGRLTSKVFADTTQEVYDYFPISGRLRSVTDALNRVKTLKYTIDGRMAAVAYSGGTVATPGVTFNYDTFYPRLTSLVDGTGTTAYQYIPLGSLGAGAVQKITTGMFAGSADFVYDRRGAMVQRSIGTGVGASTVGMTYDNWGRATSLNNDLGTFSFIYSSALSRLQQITYPTATGMSTVFNFARDATQDVRLASMTHRTGGGTPVMASSNTYGYDQSGNIQTWQQAAVATTTKQANFGYDLVDQVVSANKDGDPAAEMWTYDAVGNRRTSQSGNEVTGYSTNAVNQSLTSGVSTQGTTSLIGHTDEPARVTVNGQTVPTDSGNRFRAVVPLNQDVPIVAVDGRGNTRLRTIRIASTGPGSRTFTYDAVGNLTADGLRTYTWDAENRLVSITQGTKRSEFTYDGMSRRVRIIEKDGSAVQSNKTYLWVGAEMAEERDATGATVTKRYFSQGISIGGVKHYYCKDHLGSVREV